MPIKTVSLETAKLLKEAGFRQDTLFSFVKAKYDAEFHLSMFKNQKDFEENKIVYDGIGISSYLEVEIEESIETYSAPTTDELLEELPKKIEVKNSLWALHILCNKDSFGVSYQTIISKEYNHFLQGKKFEYYWDYLYATCQNELPEALAQMWLYLNAEGLLNAKR